MNNDQDQLMAIRDAHGSSQLSVRISTNGNESSIRGLSMVNSATNNNNRRFSSSVKVNFEGAENR